MDLRFPARAMTFAQLDPGDCFFDFGFDAPALGLVVVCHGLILNRRGPDGMHVASVRDGAVDADMLKLVGAAVMPSLALIDFAFGRAGEVASSPALYLGDGSADLGGCLDHGASATFDVESGAGATVDTAYLPRSLRRRVAVPDAAGRLATVFENRVA